MAHIKPVVINKMSELSENNMYISVYCDFCALWRDIDPEVWLDEGLPDVDYVQAVFKCSECGTKGQKQIRSLDAEKESLFMPH